MTRLSVMKKRTAAFLLAFIMCFAFVSALVFIGAEADHVCAGEDCPFCLQLAVCENLVKFTSFCAAAFAAVYFVMLFCAVLRRFAACFYEKSTLVTLNIKLSD